MYFVYIIQSKKDKSFYTGTTTDLEKRLNEHNSGKTKYSLTKKPFEIIWFCMFLQKQKAYDFERYLKHGSGHAFRNKHLI